MDADFFVVDVFEPDVHCMDIVFEEVLQAVVVENSLLLGLVSPLCFEKLRRCLELFIFRRELLVLLLGSLKVAVYPDHKEIKVVIFEN